MADAPLPVNQAYRPGKQALEKRHRSLVTCSDTQRLTGSIDLDATLAQEPDYAKQPRWDYGIGHKPTRGPERAVWVEVHTATTREVSAVIRKLEPMEEAPFSTEDQLQELITDHPELLDGKQIRPADPRRWILVTREKGIAENIDSGARWALDHLLVDQDAMPTLVEVKRGRTRGRLDRPQAAESALRACANS